MKTTIKLTTSRSITVEACKKTGGLLVGLEQRNGKHVSREDWHMDAGQWEVFTSAGDIEFFSLAKREAIAA